MSDIFKEFIDRKNTASFKWDEMYKEKEDIS